MVTASVRHIQKSKLTELLQILPKASKIKIFSALITLSSNVKGFNHLTFGFLQKFRIKMVRNRSVTGGNMEYGSLLSLFGIPTQAIWPIAELRTTGYPYIIFDFGFSILDFRLRIW